MVQLGCVGGSLLSMWTVDYFGRVNSLRIVCLIQIVGAVIQITSKSIGQLYAGRFIEGLGVGQTVAIGPCYLAEVAPPNIRGLIVSIFSGSVYFAVMLSYGSNYGTAKHMDGSSNAQWQIPLSVKVMYNGLVAIGTIFVVESPRWLFKVGKDEKAIESLCKLRHLDPDHAYIRGEIEDIRGQVLDEKKNSAHYTFLNKIHDLFTNPSLLYRLIGVGCAAHFLGQWSGSNAITIYAPRLFQLLTGTRGVENMRNTLILGCVKFVGSYLAGFFLVDTIGRKRCLLIGICGQMVCVLYFAIFVNIVPVEDPNHVYTSSERHAAQAAMAALFLAGVSWVMGFNAVQYLVGAEMFPLKLRSFAQSIIMVVHFANQFANTKAIPHMLISMKNYGTFYFMFGINFFSFFWALFCVPELKGKSLEAIEDVFKLPWYMVGLKGGKVADRSATYRATHHDEDDEDLGVVTFGGDVEKGKVGDDKENVEFVEDISRK
ncbi:qutD Probable quinate permease [Candida maltosa Xu316]